MITMLGLFIVVTMIYSFTKYSREKGAIWLQPLFNFCLNLVLNLWQCKRCQM